MRHGPRASVGTLARAILRRCPGSPSSARAPSAPRSPRRPSAPATPSRCAAAAPGPAPVVELPDGTRQALAGAIRADPARAAPADWVLLAVKTHQTAGAADWLRALCGPGTVVAVLQNGVEHRALTEPFAGPAHVLPAIVWCPSEAVSPALVRQRGPARITVPDEPAGARLAALLDAQVDLAPTSSPSRGASSASTRWRR